MSNIGQAVLQIGGTVVGSMFGFPQLGYLIGNLAGQALFPTQLPTVRGQKLEDAKVQTAALGAAIPWVWGTYILAGQIIWRSPFVERKVKEKAGGKGGPEQTSIHYEYRVNVAIGLCKGPIVGIRRIWADTKLIYDASVYPPEETPPEDYGDTLAGQVFQRYMAQLATSQFNASKFDLYLGDEAQVADATIETWEGVGNVPAYRGLAYLVLRDFELADYGNRIPNFRVEVMTEGTVGNTEIELYSNDFLYPWAFLSDASVEDPRNPQNQHEYLYAENGGSTYTDLTTALADLNSATDHPSQPFILGDTPGEGDSLYAHGWQPNSTTPNHHRPCNPESVSLQDYVTVYMSLNTLRIDGYACAGVSPPSTATVSDYAGWWAFLGAKGVVKYVYAGQSSGYYVATDHDQDPAPYFGGVPFTSDDSERMINNATVEGVNFDVWKLISHEMNVRRVLGPPDSCYGNYAIPGTDDFCVTPEGTIMPSVTWTETAGTWKVLQKYTTSGNVVTKYPLSPARPLGHADYNSQAFWEAAYAEAVYNGDMPAGLVYGVDYPETQGYGYIGTTGGTLADPSTIPLSQIVGDICDACGLTDYDVTDLASIAVHGYALASPMTGRDAIEPLRPFGYFDAVESEFEYKFVTRGHDSVATIDVDDLAAHLSTEQRPPAITVTRAQDQELPRLVRAHFIDITRDGDPGQAEQQRQTVDSVNSADLQVPVIMPAERGQAMADTVLFERWIGRNTYQIALPFKYAALEPTDCVDVAVDGTTERMRITSTELRGLSIIDITAVRDDQSIYSGTDIVGTNTGGEAIPVGSVPSPTDLVLLELPALRSQDSDCGYYAAARGVLEGWPGAILYRATSPSGAFRQVAWTSIAATIGYVTDRVDLVSNSGITDTGTSVITGGVDLSTVLRVALYSGSFASVTEADLIAGENLIAVGTETTGWELLRFQVAVLGTDGVWELSGLLREQLGTARREIEEDDRVVLMTGPGIMRIEESDTANGVERVIRAVTSGTSLEDAEDHYITTTCLSQADGGEAAGADAYVSVINRTEATTPEAPSCGDTYLVPDAPAATGDWEGQEGNLARYNCSTLSWDFTAPTTGAPIYVEAEDAFVYWSGTAITPIQSQDLADFEDLLAAGVQGEIIYRGSTGWVLLPPGTAGRFLMTNGNSANPEWSVVTGGTVGDPIFRFLDADVSITNNTTYSDVGDLVFSNLPEGQYALEGIIYTTPHATPDLKRRFHFTGTAADVAIIGNTQGAATGSFGNFAFDVEGQQTVTGNHVQNLGGSFTVTAAGDFSLQVAQVSSSGTAISVNKGSWLRLTRMA